MPYILSTLPIEDSTLIDSSHIESLSLVFAFPKQSYFFVTYETRPKTSVEIKLEQREKERKN